MERLILLASNSNNNINEGNLNSNNNFNLNLNSNSNHNIKSSNTNLTTEITIIKGKIDGKFNQFDRKSLDSLINLIIIMVNIATAVGIVVANKLVFTKYSFKYGLTLTIIHFIITWISLHILSWWFGLFQRKKLRIFDILPLCASFCGFVVLTNVSLLLNSVSFYQMAKVLTTPCVAAIQWYKYSISIKPSIQLTLWITCIGVIIATFAEVNLKLSGFLVAMIAVLITALYQIWVGTVQKELQVDALQLLYYQAPISAIMLLCLLPLFDSPFELISYKWSLGSILAILLSSLFAVGVNISTFLIIGRTSPITYNVVGHCKLMLVLLFGYLFFKSQLGLLNLFGIFIAFCGIISYSYIKLTNEK